LRRDLHDRRPACEVLALVRSLFSQRHWRTLNAKQRQLTTLRQSSSIKSPKSKYSETSAAHRDNATATTPPAHRDNATRTPRQRHPHTATTRPHQPDGTLARARGNVRVRAAFHADSALSVRALRAAFDGMEAS
jgi:hypothetical protein